jgi:hypothetical protein
MYTRIRGGMSAFCLIFAATLIGVALPRAWAQASTELDRIAQCDRDLCSIIRAPGGEGRPLRCELGRTFYKEQLDKLARSRRLIWPFGDARCTLNVDVQRAILARSMTDDRYTLKLPKHPASCEVEYRGERYPVTVQIAPEVKFEDGRATSVTLGVQEVEANIVIKALLWSASKLEDSFGLFQDDFLRGINGYVEQHCRARPSSRRQVRIDGKPVR